MGRKIFENEDIFSMETNQSNKYTNDTKYSRRMRFLFDKTPDYNDELLKDQKASDASDLDSLSEILGDYEGYVPSIQNEYIQEPFVVKETPTNVHLDSSVRKFHTTNEEGLEEKSITLKDKLRRSVRRVSKAMATAAYRSPESRLYRHVHKDKKGEVIHHGRGKVIIHCETYDANRDTNFTTKAVSTDYNKSRPSRAGGLSRIIAFRGFFRNRKNQLMNCRRSYFDDLSTDSSSEDEVCY